MGFPGFLSAIKANLSNDAQILFDPTSEGFKTALLRWTDRDLKTPGAIILVATEEDILQTVTYAVKYGVPFVPKSGGHSAWSTIGEDGIILDLSNFNKITVDKAKETVKVQSGVVNRQLIAALYEHGLCLPLGSGNAIGSVPQALGGGLCGLSKICGTTSDNILSARLITASGDLITVDSNTPDLLWALKGAGQFFGLVTELTLQAYPISTLGSDDGTLWTGTFIFDIPQVGAVVNAASKLMDDEEHNAANLCVITTNPQSGTPCFLVMSLYFGSTAGAEEYTAPIKALGPLVALEDRIAYAAVNDSMDPFCVQGGFKQFNLAGMTRFDPTPWQEIANIFVDLHKRYPEVGTGGYGFEWVSGKQKKVELDSAWSHTNVKSWVESLSWYTDPLAGPDVDKATAEVLAIATRSFKPEEIHTYQNFTRESSLESRFGSRERIEKLQKLKRTWDPLGVFTKQLL